MIGEVQRCSTNICNQVGFCARASAEALARKCARGCSLAMEAGIASLYDSHSIQRWTEEAQQMDQELPLAPMLTMPAAAVSAADPSRQHNQGRWPQGQQQYDHEGITGAFSPVAVLGIRSLPDALHPGYRMELLLQLHSAEKQRQHSRAHASSSVQQQTRNGKQQDTDQQRSLKGGSTIGRVPQHYGPLDGYFSCFQHITSEYERRQVVQKFEELNSKLAQVGVDDFVVRNCPPPVQHSTTFAVYRHDLPPFVEVDYLGRPLHCLQPHVRPFLPAGRNSRPDMLLKGQLPDLLAALDAALAKDWPRSFIKAFTDHVGCVVLCFDRAAAAAEGDLTSYLNHQEKHGTIMLEFKLTKDSDRWGVLEGDGASVFYVLTPPWVRSRAVDYV